MKKLLLLLTLAACGKSSGGQSKATKPQEVGTTGWLMEVPTDCKLAADGDGFVVKCGKATLATLVIEAALDHDPDCHYERSKFGDPGAKEEAGGLLWTLCVLESKTDPMRKIVAASMPLADGRALRCESETTTQDANVRGAICYKMRLK
jgi:hypothetical protein